MKAKISILLLLTIASISANSQYKFGIHGGVGLSNYIGKDFSSDNDSKLGITAGLFYEHELNYTLSVGAEINYEKKGSSYNFFPRLGTMVSVDSKLTYISIPIIIKAYFGQKANYYIYSGISGSRLNGSELTHTASENGFEISSAPFFPYKLNQLDASVVAGVGLNFYEIILDIRYQHGLINIYESNNAPSIRNHYLSVTIGYSIFKKKIQRCFNNRPM